MTVANEPPLVGADVVIHCKDKWTCCEREQAKAKVDNYNATIKKKGPLKILESVSDDLNDEKDICQRSYRAKMDADMAKDKNAAADNYATSPCLAKQLKESESPGSARSDMKLDMDHPVEVKVGGPATTALKALSGSVNRSLGSGFAKNTGDKLRKNNCDQIASVSMVCPAPCKPPGEGDENKDYSTGDHKNRPPQPGGTREFRTSATAAWQI